jgi:hypothetical protein
MAADCDTNYYLLLTKFRENKQKSHRFHMEIFNLKELRGVESKEKYHVEVSNKFAALEDLDMEVENNNA